MTDKTKRDIRAKARLTYGLLNILKCDIDNLRVDVNDYNLDNLSESIRETNETLGKLIEVVAELELIIYLSKMNEH